MDPVAANGETPLGMCYGSEYNAQAMLLLEWGADISNNALLSKEIFIELALKQGNSKLANLLKSEFGGRRCEISNLCTATDDGYGCGDLRRRCYTYYDNMTKV